jgi:hypothetical protein
MAPMPTHHGFKNVCLPSILKSNKSGNLPQIFLVGIIALWLEGKKNSVNSQPASRKVGPMGRKLNNIYGIVLHLSPYPFTFADSKLMGS